MAKKIIDKVKAAIKKPAKKVLQSKDTLHMPVAEQSHPEYDADMPLNKQRHLR